MDEKNINQRLEQLEERAAFAEKNADELSDAVNEQWVLIEKLKREVERLTDELKAVEDNITHGGDREPPPPHY